MRVNAYILAADPAWIEKSVLSYYNLVDEIVVSFDMNNRGWTGVPIEVDECLMRLQAIDCKKKMRMSPGHYARLEYTPMENDTHQRQCALDEAGQGADWVLQLDTDEVVADLTQFTKCLNEADQQGYKSMDYPARWLYKQLSRRLFLEACTRFWRISASFPGPVAVKPGVKLHMGRQCKTSLFRVDFRKCNTDIWHPTDAPVHQVIKDNQGIIHYAWVRSEEYMARKSGWSGHAKDFDWSPKLRHWSWAGRHPLLAMLLSPLSRGPNRKHFRIMKVP